MVSIKVPRDIMRVGSFALYAPHYQTLFLSTRDTYVNRTHCFDRIPNHHLRSLFDNHTDYEVNCLFTS